MNRLGMIIDLTNSSSDTQLKVLEASKAPCIFSSVATNSLATDARNIKDSVIDAIVRILSSLHVFFYT